MQRALFLAVVLCAGYLTATAQSLDDLNIQIHGYATQGFLYSTNNNLFTTNSSSGSPAWTEAVINITSQPYPKLRVGAQGRYELLGNIGGTTLSLDWAEADYRYNDKLGMRFGKVKTPDALFNEVQDIDPAYIWSLLPQSIYPLTSRNSFLSHYGGVAYGTLQPDKRLGKLEYRVFGGEGVDVANDPTLTLGEENSPVQLPNGWTGTLYGGTLHWVTPLKGLMVGSSDLAYQYWSSLATLNTGTTTINGSQYSWPCQYYWNYAQYEHDKVMVAGEYSRQQYAGGTTFPTDPSANSTFRVDVRAWYAMATYRLASKLIAGIYDSQSFDHQQPLQPVRYSKDWAISGRYDFNTYLYLKAEQHFVDGTALGYDANTNAGGLRTTTRLTLLKMGVNF
jgi:hypothetical protein